MACNVYLLRVQQVNLRKCVDKFGPLTFQIKYEAKHKASQVKSIMFSELTNWTLRTSPESAQHLRSSERQH